MNFLLLFQYVNVFLAPMNLTHISTGIKEMSFIINVEWSFSIQSTQSQQGISFGWIIKIICWRVPREAPRDLVYSFYNSYLGLFLLQVGGALNILGGVRSLDPGLGHVKHLPLLRLLRRLCANLLVLLDSVVSKISSAHSTGRKVIPWLWSEYGLPGGCGGGLKMSNFMSLVYSSVEKCFVMGIKEPKIHVSTGAKQGINLIPLLNISSPFSWARGRAELTFWHL